MRIHETFQRRSGRVISIGRLMLAALFLAAVLIDSSQPAIAASETYGLLAAYVILALAITIATWNDWWLDARLALPAHVVDVAMFTTLVLSTHGYTSPFFLLFVFLILSPAIRWGWRETAVTAAIVVTLYLIAGIVAAGGADFELQRFFVRSGHLIILSGLLIWFGANQGLANVALKAEDFEAAAALDESPFEAALRQAMKVTGSGSGLLVWRSAGQDELFAIAVRDGELRTVAADSAAKHFILRDEPLLFSIPKRRALARDRNGRFRFHTATTIAPPGFGISEGLVFPIRTDTGEGEIYLQDVNGLSTDHLALAPQLKAQCEALIQRHALLCAVNEGAEDRARLAFARDLHDSIVQFLSGAAFQLEAASRTARRGADPAPRLRELKQLILEEQKELRSFIATLRQQRDIPASDLEADMRALAEKLGRQWQVECTVETDLPETTVPMRLSLDARQLVSEAVANAVRHGKAGSVAIRLSLVDGALQLELTNDGRPLPPSMTDPAPATLQPWSLKERVDHAGGQMSLASSPAATTVSISLPKDGRRP